MAADGKVVCMVTGGSGLYGMAIRAHVAQSEEEKDATWVFLSSKDGDLRDRKATEAIFERVRPTHVIHLAAMVGGLFANMSKKVEFYRENMLMCFISVSLRGREQQRAESARGTTRGRLTPSPSQERQRHGVLPHLQSAEARVLPVDVHLPRQDDVSHRRDDDPRRRAAFE